MSNIATIARPYAKAAFALAKQENAVSAWSNFLNTAKEVVCDPQMTAFLKDPCRTSQQRVECLSDICNQRIDGIQRETHDFFKLLAEYDRLLLLPKIAELFEMYRIEEAQQANVEIISGLPLSDTEQQRLATALKARLKREITFEYKTDASLIGGVVIKANDLVIDGSIRGKLARLNMLLTA